MNCVIFPSNLDSPLENWMDGKDNKLTSKYRARLKTCVDRALASSKRSDFRKRFPRCPKRIQKVFLEFLASGPILCHFCRQGCSPLWFYVISIIDDFMWIWGWPKQLKKWLAEVQGVITFIEWLVGSFLVQLIQDSLVHWFIIDSFIWLTDSLIDRRQLEAFCHYSRVCYMK